MGKTAWKQYTSGNKPYYVNSSTKETVVSSCCDWGLADSSGIYLPTWSS